MKNKISKNKEEKHSQTFKLGALADGNKHILQNDIHSKHTERNDIRLHNHMHINMRKQR